MIAIEVADLRLPPGVTVPQVRSVCASALACLDLANYELSVVLCDDAAIRLLNAEWRGMDKSTDVLSFPQNDFPEGPGRPPKGARVLGDIVISVETATRQAVEAGIATHSELAVLLIHGICHLLGWDHENAEDSAKMRAIEATLLAGVGETVPSLIERAGG